MTNSPTIAAWIEAIRPRTLPVSVAGVVAALALSVSMGSVRWLPAILCVLFALLCQVASNFANEYFDFQAGIDRKGRSGPRRGVTEGDINPRSMLTAVWLTLFFACLTGLWLIYWGGVWLVLVGVFIVLGALAYSAGPYPLSRHGLGEVAVLVFFGIIPVNLTFWLVSGYWTWTIVLFSLAIGLMSANVLLVNNFRDADDDLEVGKRTLANIVGRKVAREIYLWNGIIAFVLSVWGCLEDNIPGLGCVIYILGHLWLWRRLRVRPGVSLSVLNPLLGQTALLMLIYSIFLFF
ncbi:MAG: 1,4-dihydroxy-2-naphthoate octaprenyltransferase [Muribaculaceae bacterium]|nr:1,4-dihydroxy-2-naphthoate octaprenyltransferase [Muribaculaceae bacterium]